MSSSPFPESAFSFAGIPGVVHQDTPEPATPTSVMSDSDASASDFLSPTKLASSGKINSRQAKEVFQRQVTGVVNADSRTSKEDPGGAPGR